ncbi:unnamed protein product [Lepidochelys olivacea]
MSRSPAPCLLSQVTLRGPLCFVCQQHLQSPTMGQHPTGLGVFRAEIFLRKLRPGLCFKCKSGKDASRLTEVVEHELSRVTTHVAGCMEWKFPEAGTVQFGRCTWQRGVAGT